LIVLRMILRSLRPFAAAHPCKSVPSVVNTCGFFREHVPRSGSNLWGIKIVLEQPISWFQNLRLSVSICG
jgi:hypothetical protein